MIILGLSYPSHITSACIINEQKVLHAVCEERLSGIKNDSSFPEKAIKQCLTETNLSFRDIDYISVNWDPYNGIIRRTIDLLKNDFKSLFLKSGPSSRANFSTWKKIFFIDREISKYFNIPYNHLKNKIKFVNHHTSHINSAYYFSEFDESLVLSVDGAGEIEAIKLGYFNKLKQFKVLKKQYFPHSAGFFYSAITQFLGFEPENHEYKVMGMAAYGKTYLKDEMNTLVNTNNDKFFTLNMDYFSFNIQSSVNEFGTQVFFKDKIQSILGKPRYKNQRLLQHHFDIALSVQIKFEEIMKKAVEFGIKKTKIKNLCITGGCALNGLSNGKILEKTKIKKLFVPPWANDIGGSIGSAVEPIINNKSKIRFKKFKMEGDFLGKEFSDNEILDVASKMKLKLTKPKNIFLETSEILKDKKILIWFQGRLEMGPRALGNRSFLADPRDEKIKDKINSIIKKREMFRPFAPSVIHEDANKYFVMNRNYSPYMTVVFKVREEYKKYFKAIVHEDGTARVQTVSQFNNYKYWKLLKTYKTLTGYGLLLNTSLNIKEQPIIENPVQAFKIFLETKVDAIVINDFLLQK